MPLVVMRNVQIGRLVNIGLVLVCNCCAERCESSQYKLLKVVMSAAYHGGISVGTDNQWRGNPALESSISRAMDWWFTRDFTNDACLDNGSATSTACPCSSPGLWNTNWYSNVRSKVLMLLSCSINLF
jgi:hypothetical protein